MRCSSARCDRVAVNAPMHRAACRSCRLLSPAEKRLAAPRCRCLPAVGFAREGRPRARPYHIRTSYDDEACPPDVWRDEARSLRPARRSSGGTRCLFRCASTDSPCHTVGGDRWCAIGPPVGKGRHWARSGLGAAVQGSLRRRAGTEPAWSLWHTLQTRSE